MCIENKNHDEIIEIKIINTLFKVKKSGDIERKMRSGNWKLIKNSPNQNKGYNVILVDKKQIMRSRIIIRESMILF